MMFDWDDPIWRHLQGDEIAALAEIRRWASKPPSLVDKAMALAARPIEAAYGLVPEAMKRAVASTIQGTLGMLRDGAGCTVREGAVLRRLNPHGIVVSRLEQVWDMELAELDRHANGIIQSHALGAACLGGGTGVAGLPGLLADLPALYTMLFRMVLELGFLYGFDSHSPIERHLALELIMSGHNLEKATKEGVLQEVTRVQTLLHKGATWKELEESLLVVAIQRMAERLGMRIVKRKLAQTIVVLGALVGTAGNYGLTRDVGFTAFQGCRLRFLHRRATRRRGW